MKSKIKKVLVSIHLFFVGMVSKVFAVSPTVAIQPEYGIESPIKKWLGLGKLILFFIVFVIGLSVIISKKITKKVKAIVISIIILLAILGHVLVNYNF